MYNSILKESTKDSAYKALLLSFLSIAHNDYSKHDKFVKKVERCNYAETLEMVKSEFENKGEKEAMDEIIKSFSARIYHYYYDKRLTLKYLEGMTCYVKDSNTVVTIFDVAKDLYGYEFKISNIYDILNKTDIDNNAALCGDMYSMIISFFCDLGKFDIAYNTILQVLKKTKNAIIAGSGNNGVSEIRYLAILTSAYLAYDKKKIAADTRQYISKYYYSIQHLDLEYEKFLTDNEYKKYHKRIMSQASKNAIIANNRSHECTPLGKNWMGREYVTLDYLDALPRGCVNCMDFWFDNNLETEIRKDEERFIRICRYFIYNIYNYGQKTADIKQYLTTIENVLERIESKYTILDVCEGLSDRVYTLALEASIK